jgi:hypothetical protein
MSYAAYNAVEIQETASNKQINTQKSKAFSAHGAPTFLADPVTRRVVEVVDYELAQGSMPA